MSLFLLAAVGLSVVIQSDIIIGLSTHSDGTGGGVLGDFGKMHFFYFMLLRMANYTIGTPVRYSPHLVWS